jgi:hypothetical protein
MPIWPKLKPLVPMLATIALLLLVATSALGQCSMCRASLAGSNNPFFIRNFNIGVLVLLLPPVTIFCTIFVALKRYRAADEETEYTDENDHNKDGNS